MKRTIIRTFLITTFVAISFSCGEHKKNENGDDSKLQSSPQINEVEVITLKREAFKRQLLSNGQLHATKKSSLMFGTTGKIERINVRNGQRINRGATIASVERPDLTIAKESAEIAIMKAELDFKDFLIGQGYHVEDTASIPKDILETARLKSGLTSAKNSLEKALYDISGTVITAPFSGRIADLNFHVYDQYTGNDPLCTLVDDNILDVEFTIMESEYSFISTGLNIIVQPFADLQKSYSGTIIDINPLVDTKGQISVRAQVRNDGSLLDGMNVRVTVERTINNQFVVPRNAVVIRDNLDVLFTYTDDGKAHWTYVNILHSNGDYYAVEGNSSRNAVLNEGDLVIISGNLNLADKSEVVLKEQ